MNRIGEGHGLIEGACLDVQRLEVTRALMPKARSATRAEGTFKRMSGGRLACPKRRLAPCYFERVSPNNERETKSGRRLLLTFSAMANVQSKRLPWGKVPNVSTLAAATLVFV